MWCALHIYKHCLQYACLPRRQHDYHAGSSVPQHKSVQGNPQVKSPARQQVGLWPAIKPKRSGLYHELAFESFL